MTPAGQPRVLLSGARGFIGSALAPELARAGWNVVRLVRGRAPADAQAIAWDPAHGFDNPTDLDGIDAVVHLAGENIMSRRWSPAQKARIRDSRVTAASTLAQALARASAPPATLLVASGIGFYGNSGACAVDEDSPRGAGFLADLCCDLQESTRPAEQAGVRVVHMRFGVVLHPRGGALAQMLPAFRFGFGGRLGPGTQYMSWVTLDDLVRAVVFLLGNSTLRGPVNITSPNPVTNAEFTRALGLALHRPTPFAVPAFALRLALGDAADELLLTGVRAVPARLAAAGFEFRHPHIAPALAGLLAQPA